MHRGSAITGTVRTGGGNGSHATVTAANKGEQSFTTIANSKGQFAIGGLPEGSYSVFTYDHKKTYVGKSTYVKKLKAGKPQNLDIRLNKRAGNLLVDLYAGDRHINGKLMVTAISKRTGQFWVVKARKGTAKFQGLYPGRYTLVVPGYGDFFARTGNVSRGNVHAGRTAFGSFRLTQHGGAFTGRIVSRGALAKPIGGASLWLYDSTGSVIADATSAANGTFRIGGRLGTMSGLSLLVYEKTTMYEPDRIVDLQIRVNQTKALGDVPVTSNIPTESPSPSASPTASPSTSPSASPSASASTTPSTSPSASATASPTASATPGLSGTVVDASNMAIHLADAVVQVFNSNGVKLAETTSGTSGGFRFTAKLGNQSNMSVIVQPGPYTDYMGTDEQRCQYRWTQHGGVYYTAGDDTDIGPVGLSRKEGGNCRAPLGDPVKH